MAGYQCVAHTARAFQLALAGYMGMSATRMVLEGKRTAPPKLDLVLVECPPTVERLQTARTLVMVTRKGCGFGFWPLWRRHSRLEQSVRAEESQIAPE